LNPAPAKNSLASSRISAKREGSPRKVILRGVFIFPPSRCRHLTFALGGQHCEAASFCGMDASCRPLPQNQRHGISHSSQKQASWNDADQKRHGSPRERCEEVRVLEMHRRAACQKTSQAVLKIDAEWKGERIADPCARDGSGDVCPQEKRSQSSCDHLHGKRHECEEGTYCHAGGKFLPCGMPKLICKESVSENAMYPCATNVFCARQVAQIPAKSGAPPLYGFHFLKRVSVVLMLATQDCF